MNKLHIFYEEIQTDRWIIYDRYPRSLIRRLIRGKAPISGVKRWFVNLIQGLDELGYPYDINNFQALKKDPLKWALVIGRPHVIDKIPKHSPIIYGPALPSHPNDNNFWGNENIKHLLAPCKWMKALYERDLTYKKEISVWPSGIETKKWIPVEKNGGNLRILVYDKIRWNYNNLESTLLKPILNTIVQKKILVEYIRYGSYKEEDYCKLLSKVDGMIFLCEHETQGFAYQQALSTNTPIFAWDRGGFWQDPSYYPHSVNFEGVSSVPYWDKRCGEKFKNLDEFNDCLDLFLIGITQKKYAPRNYILENLTLQSQAKAYIELVNHITKKR
jgi:hypothetical protein